MNRFRRNYEEVVKLKPLLVIARNGVTKQSPGKRPPAILINRKSLRFAQNGSVNTVLTTRLLRFRSQLQSTLNTKGAIIIMN
jgi:hypothetical protein